MAKHIKSLDGLRFLFILTVFLHHSGVDSMAPLAWMAMEFFFILSGFVLTHIYHQQILSHTFSYKSFLGKRMLRVLPLYYFSLLAIFILIPLDWLDIDKAYPSFFLIQAWMPGYAMGGIGVGWFTSVIISFYLIFPFLCSWVLNMRRRTLVLLVTALFVMSLIYSALLPSALANDWKDIFAPARLVDCFYGIVLYRLFFMGVPLHKAVINTPLYNILCSKRLICGAIIALVFSLYLLGIYLYWAWSDGYMISSEFFILPASILVAGCAYAEYHAGSLQPRGIRLLSSAPMVFLGGIAFEIYFIHSLVLSKMRASAHFRHWDWPLWQWVIVAGIATLIGAICWHKGFGAILTYIKKKCATSR